MELNKPVSDTLKKSTFDDDSVSQFTRGETSHFDGSGGDPAERPAYIDPIVAEREERAVFWSRLVVITILSIALALLATTMYLLISRNEQADFESQVSQKEKKTSFMTPRSLFLIFFAFLVLQLRVRD